MKNCIESLACQTEGWIETIISDYGSDESHLKELVALSKDYGVTLIHVDTDHIWSISKAYNVGLRRSHGKYAATIDADIVFEPDVIRKTLEILDRNSSAFVIRQPIFLGEGVKYSTMKLPDDYDVLDKEPEVYVAPSVGSFCATMREWWFKVRGFDERFNGYGSEDWEMWRRATHGGRRIVLIGKDVGFKFPKIAPEENCKLYHQWHPSTSIRMGLPESELEAHRGRNREIYSGDKSLVRNGPDWGLMDNGN